MSACFRSSTSGRACKTWGREKVEDMKLKIAERSTWNAASNSRFLFSFLSFLSSFLFCLNFALDQVQHTIKTFLHQRNTKFSFSLIFVGRPGEQTSGHTISCFLFLSQSFLAWLTLKRQSVSTSFPVTSLFSLTHNFTNCCRRWLRCLPHSLGCCCCCWFVCCGCWRLPTCILLCVLCVFDCVHGSRRYLLVHFILFSLFFLLLFTLTSMVSRVFSLILAISFSLFLFSHFSDLLLWWLWFFEITFFWHFFQFSIVALHILCSLLRIQATNLVIKQQQVARVLRFFCIISLSPSPSLHTFVLLWQFLLFCRCSFVILFHVVFALESFVFQLRHTPTFSLSPYLSVWWSFPEKSFLFCCPHLKCTTNRLVSSFLFCFPLSVFSVVTDC